MNKKLRYIFFSALLTSSGIIAFQLYWLYNAYKVNEDNFNKVASATLQRSIDQVLLKAAFNYLGGDTAKSYYTFSSDTTFNVPNNDKTGKKDPDSTKIVVVKDHQINITDKTNPETAARSHGYQSEGISKDAAKFIVSALIPRVMKAPLKEDTLLEIYSAELDKNGINIPVRITLHDTATTGIIGYIGSADNHDRVSAHFSQQQQYLLRQTLVPMLVSFILMVLTAGCLWYMWRVIWQQKQLADMKNDFINNMTHELKTPISILKTTHEALYHFGEVSNMEKTMRYLHANTIELNKLENNVERILDITRYERGNEIAHSENIALETAMQAVIARFAISNDYRIELQYQLPDAIITTDKYAIETILANLLDNAIKYSDKPGNLVTVIVSPLLNGWQLSVSDQGQGIHARQLPFIFDKFFRIPTGNLHNVKGYGLGLSYVKELTKLLQGSISVQSKPGVGTTFTLQFPHAWKL